MCVPKLKTFVGFINVFLFPECGLNKRIHAIENFNEASTAMFRQCVIQSLFSAHFPAHVPFHFPYTEFDA